MKLRLTLAIAMLVACNGNKEDPSAGRRRWAKSLEESIRKTGGTDRLDVRGADGTTLVFTTSQCSQDYLKLQDAMMPGAFAEPGFVTIECTDPSGATASLVLGKPATAGSSADPWQH